MSDTNAGSAGDQAAPEQPTFTREQIGDPTFYKANRDAIFRAVKDGRITGKSRGGRL